MCRGFYNFPLVPQRFFLCSDVYTIKTNGQIRGLFLPTYVSTRHYIDLALNTIHVVAGALSRVRSATTTCYETSLFGVKGW